jgi:hypothetical protein
MEKAMKILIAAVTSVVLLGGASAGFAQSAPYETAGLPITSHQAALLGEANLRERAGAPDLVVNGVPASLHQMAVLAPRPRQAAAAPAAREQKTN